MRFQFDSTFSMAIQPQHVSTSRGGALISDAILGGNSCKLNASPCSGGTAGEQVQRGDVSSGGKTVSHQVGASIS